MFTPKKLQGQQFLASIVVKLPLDILLALPDYITRDVAAPRFNLFGAVSRLLGRAGWENASKVINPRIWSPGWGEEQLRSFATSEFLARPELLRDVWIEGLRAEAFPVRLPDEASPLPLYDIVHFIGRVESRDDDPALVISDDSGQALRAGVLRDSLVASQTRFLILQVPLPQLEEACLLAEMVTAGGGPATLAVTGREAGAVDVYLLSVYANIIHNQPFPELTRPEPWMDYSPPLSIGDAQLPSPLERVTAHLFYAQGGEGLLRFEPYIAHLNARLNSALKDAFEKRDRLQNLLEQRSPYLHKKQIDETNETLQSLDDLFIVDNQVKLMNVRWDHESEGVMPTAEVAYNLTMIEEAHRRSAAMESELTGDAPRVLNANFWDSERAGFLDRGEGLLAERDYDLRVDIGPVWDKAISIVTGNAEFPEKALSLTGEGYVVDVVLVSSDFRPPIVTAQMWVPRGSGRSSPYREGRHDESGPVTLRVRTPALPVDAKDPFITAHARLSIYYENNLLQSAVVKVGVVRAANLIPAEKNAIEMDFALTGSFQNLEARYARREMVAAPGAQAEAQPVVLNLTLNDDGAGNHRIVVKNRQELAAWTYYDPSDARATLDQARQALLDCFYAWDEKTGKRSEKIGLSDATNGKAKIEFLRDLLQLAYVGRDLWDKAFSGARYEQSGMLRAEWGAALRAALAGGGVIQVARTGPANYAYPWALLYDIPLSTVRSENWLCQVTDEWSDDGIRRRPPNHAGDWPGAACPYGNRASHQKNTICPYGFWGLKQIIEQPLSALERVNGNWQPRETPVKLSYRASLDMAVGVTDDLPADERTAHLRKVSGIKHIRFNPSLPADDSNKVRTMLRAPVLVYFLCHGEYDRARSRPYLSIGQRINDDRYKIYPNTVSNWADAQEFDTEEWKNRHPLIFINGCHTADLVPGEVLNFVTPFSDAGASGVVGSEINILWPMASKVAEDLFTRFAAGISIGAAMQQIRWELANKGNLLGLAYTLYCMASLRAVSEGQ